MKEQSVGPEREKCATTSACPRAEDRNQQQYRPMYRERGSDTPADVGVALDLPRQEITFCDESPFIVVNADSLAAGQQQRPPWNVTITSRNAKCSASEFIHGLLELGFT
jgi:hypothetical protein